MQKKSTSIPDWQREKITQQWQPSKRLLKSLRSYQKWQKKPGFVGKLLSKLAVLQHRIWSVICGCDIPINSKLDGGLLLPHPTGVVIHPNAKIGPNCLILQQVTIVEDVVLEGGVDIGAGAKIIAPITIGAGAKVGANAVVLQDIPSHATAVGIPAKVIRRE